MPIKTKEDIVLLSHKQDPQDYDAQILKFLSLNKGRAFPLNFLSQFLQIEQTRCCRRLIALEKYGLIKKATLISGYPLFAYNFNAPTFSVSQMKMTNKKILPESWREIKND